MRGILGKGDESSKYSDEMDCSYVKATKLNVKVKLSQNCTENLILNKTLGSSFAHAKNQQQGGITM